MPQVKSEPRTEGPLTAVALAHFDRLKPDHRELLRAMIADRGMASSTLETLVGHLLEEEDPSILATARASQPVARTQSRDLDTPRPTVGSLRTQAASPAMAVGNLRKG